MKQLIKDYLIITIGIFIVAIGLNIFLIPADLAVGGITGLAMVINNVWPWLSISSLMLVMNIILFIIAFILIGSHFGAKTIYASFGLSGMMWVMERLFPNINPITDDILLNLIYGILIQGIGMAIIFFQNASTGGTDIIAKILNKYFHLDIGKALLISDFFITVLAGVSFGARLGLYALLGVIINGFVIDQVITGLNIKIKVTIISEYPDMIKEYIIDELERGATIYSAEGAYTRETKIVITSVMSKREFVSLRNYIKSLDKSAFVTGGIVHEVLGEGFISGDV